MNHIRSRWVNNAGIIGELSPSDYGVFINVSDLAHVSRFWESLVTHAIAVDKASSNLAAAATEPYSEDPEHSAWLENQRAIAAHAHFYLTRAALLSLLDGFVEFMLLEVYKLLFGLYPPKKRPEFEKDLVKPLQSKLGDLKLPDLYVDTMKKSRDTIRNALQHGRWMGLNESSHSVDIHDAFLGIASFAYEIEMALRNAGKTD
jgi:hypothetical protein